MTNLTPQNSFRKTKLALSIAVGFVLPLTAFADAVTDWNYYSILATKGATSKTTGAAGNALNSNVATRIEAIEARAVFDAVNAINKFSAGSYYYKNTGAISVKTAVSASVAAAQAAHDVLVGVIASSNTGTINWLNSQLTADLNTLGAANSDPGIAIGQAAAAAALVARTADFSQIRTTYIPSSNISATGGASVTGNPGIGLWRPNNGAAGAIDPVTGAPTGFDASGNIVAAAAIDFNWKNVTPFSLTSLEKQQLVAEVPPALVIGSPEYIQELSFVQTHGESSGFPGSRTNDQLLHALYYKQDAEIFINEAARLAVADRAYSINQNANLFAALDSALADSRIATWQAKYDIDFWRPITAINADSTGNVTSYAWQPLATTPAHPSAPAGHSATIAAGTEILRAFFKSDNILSGGAPVTLTSIPWIVSTNNGTGKLQTAISGQDATTRSVNTLTQLQLENGQSRLYLGVHFGNDNYQGQTLGLLVSDTIIGAQLDPAVKGLTVFKGASNVATGSHLHSILVNNSSASGFFGL